MNAPLYSEYLSFYEKFIESFLETPENEIAYRLKKEKNIPSEATAPLAALIATLQKARRKLPTFYAARCAVPPPLYAQATAEITSQLKFGFKGKRLLDLTFGLGVDSLYFSNLFDEIFSVESLPDFFNVGLYNLSKLNNNNISLLNETAENFVEKLNDCKFDWVYLDPARRNSDGKRYADPAQLSPNVFELFPYFIRAKSKVLLKLSPLFDPQAALQTFAPYLKNVYCLAIDGENKELLLELSFDESNSDVFFEARFMRKSKDYSFRAPTQEIFFPPEIINSALLPNATYLYEPDVSLYYLSLSKLYFEKNFPATFQLTFQSGYALSDVYLPDFAGRVFQIKAAFPFESKVIHRYLKAQKLERLNVTHKYFPQGVETVRKNLGLPPEGGTQYLILTRLQDKSLFAFLCERII